MLANIQPVYFFYSVDERNGWKKRTPIVNKGNTRDTVIKGRKRKSVGHTALRKTFSNQDLNKEHQIKISRFRIWMGKGTEKRNILFMGVITGAGDDRKSKSGLLNQVAKVAPCFKSVEGAILRHS